MGVVAKGENEKQRKRMNKGLGKTWFEERAAQERAPPHRDEVKCQKCGFKARYQFIRCPECNEVQK